jgi:hypothetical protein
MFESFFFLIYIYIYGFEFGSFYFVGYFAFYEKGIAFYENGVRLRPFKQNVIVPLIYIYFGKVHILLYLHSFINQDVLDI